MAGVRHGTGTGGGPGQHCWGMTGSGRTVKLDAGYVVYPVRSRDAGGLRTGRGSGCAGTAGMHRGARRPHVAGGSERQSKVRGGADAVRVSAGVHLPRWALCVAIVYCIGEAVGKGSEGTFSSTT